MARNHLAYRNIYPQAVEAAKTLIQGRFWQADYREAQQDACQQFVNTVAPLYGVPVPPVEFVEAIGSSGFSSRTWGVVSDFGVMRIQMTHFSVTNLFVAFRSWTHECGRGRIFVDDDRQKWAASLFYLAAPRRFRRMVRAGRINLGVTVRDTYTSETWQRLVVAGLAEEDDEYDIAELIVPNVKLSDLVRVENGEVTVEELVNSILDATEQDGQPSDAGASSDSIEPPVVNPAEQGCDSSGRPIETFDPPTVDGSLEDLNITQLRRLSRDGVVSGGYSMHRDVLIAALRAAGVQERATETV